MNTEYNTQVQWPTWWVNEFTEIHSSNKTLL